jgi:hypothetical protein
LIGLSSVFDKKVGDFLKIGFESPCRMKAEESERLFTTKGGYHEQKRVPICKKKVV